MGEALRNAWTDVRGFRGGWLDINEDYTYRFLYYGIEYLLTVDLRSRSPLDRSFSFHVDSS